MAKKKMEPDEEYTDWRSIQILIDSIQSMLTEIPLNIEAEIIEPNSDGSISTFDCSTSIN